MVSLHLAVLHPLYFQGVSQIITLCSALCFQLQSEVKHPNLVVVRIFLVQNFFACVIMLLLFLFLTTLKLTLNVVAATFEISVTVFRQLFVVVGNLSGIFFMDFLVQ